MAELKYEIIEVKPSGIGGCDVVVVKWSGANRPLGHKMIFNTKLGLPADDYENAYEKVMDEPLPTEFIESRFIPTGLTRSTIMVFLDEIYQQRLKAWTTP